MCGICGVWGAKRNWTVKAHNPAVFGAPPGAADRLRERGNQGRMTNQALKPFGVKVASWGDGWMLEHATGASLFVEDLTAIWKGAESLARRKIDPLDPAVIAAVLGSRPGAGTVR
jgi:hypothetical protein